LEDQGVAGFECHLRGPYDLYDWNLLAQKSFWTFGQFYDKNTYTFITYYKY
jgi:hypothetical protein